MGNVLDKLLKAVNWKRSAKKAKKNNFLVVVGVVALFVLSALNVYEAVSLFIATKNGELRLDWFPILSTFGVYLAIVVRLTISANKNADNFRRGIMLRSTRIIYSKNTAYIMKAKCPNNYYYIVRNMFLFYMIIGIIHIALALCLSEVGFIVLTSIEILFISVSAIICNVLYELISSSGIKIDLNALIKSE